MHIMTKDGWKALSPKVFVKPGHVPSLLEQMGIDMAYDPTAAMAAYANGSGRGCYFTYKPNGNCFQSKGAINPLPGMYQEQVETGE